jgi:HK97 gp10 family phage protein
MTLESRIPQIVVEMKAKGIEAERRAAAVWAQEAASRAPKDTGALAASVHVEGENEVVADAVNEQGTPYGAYVEFGTSDTPAQPFFRPAEDVAKRHFEADLTVELKAL